MPEHDEYDAKEAFKYAYIVSPEGLITHMDEHGIQHEHLMTQEEADELGLTLPEYELVGVATGELFPQPDPTHHPIQAAGLSLLSSVRYVKNGRKGCWWAAAKANGQIHASWKIVPRELLEKRDFPKILESLKVLFGTKPGAVADFNALHTLLESPSKHLWITFEDRFLWWCTVQDGVVFNPQAESKEKGNFWLLCDHPWSNLSIYGKPLSISDLPGTVSRVAGFKGVVAKPLYSLEILRVIRGEKDPDAAKSAEARLEYRNAVRKIIQRLSWQDFEQLIDLILARQGWARISKVGNSQEGIDIDAENLAAGEIAYVQVKGSAKQSDLNDYVERFKKARDRYSRMIFAVNNPDGDIQPPSEPPAVQVWTGDRIADLVVRSGLGEWVENRLA